RRGAESSRAVRQSGQAHRGFQAVAKAGHDSDWRCAKDWIFTFADAGALRRCAAGTLRFGQKEIYALHITNSPVRGPRGASCLVSKEPRFDALAERNGRAYFRHGTQFRG